MHTDRVESNQTLKSGGMNTDRVESKQTLKSGGMQADRVESNRVQSGPKVWRDEHRPSLLQWNPSQPSGVWSPLKCTGKEFYSDGKL